MNQETIDNNALLDKALDFLLETQQDNDYVCCILGDRNKEENDYCANNCTNMNKECILRFLKYYCKK